MQHNHALFCRLLRSVLLGAAFMTIMTTPASADEEASVVEMMRNGQLEQALSLAEQRLAKSPRDPAMRFLKGLLQQKSAKHNDAIATYRRLIQDHPTLPEPYHNLAVLYAGQGQFEQARSTLEQAARASRSLANIHENLGNVYAQLAMRSYRQALLPREPGLAQTSGTAPIQQLIAKPMPGAPAEPGAARPRRARPK
jgi:tetratricopeptide (TPR) repeat protein